MALGGSPVLTPAQKLHHLNHGTELLVRALGLLVQLLPVAAGAAMLLDHDRIATPPALWLSSTALVVGELSVRFLIYTRGMGRSLRTAALGILASFSLTHVAPMAALTAALGRPMPWTRTSKFRADSTGVRRALLDARAELRMLVLLAGSGTALILLATSTLTIGLGIGLLLQAAMYLAAPVVAVLAERELAAEISAATDQPFPATPSPTAGTDTLQIDLRRALLPPVPPRPRERTSRSHGIGRVDPLRDPLHAPHTRRHVHRPPRPHPVGPGRSDAAFGPAGPAPFSGGRHHAPEPGVSAEPGPGRRTPSRAHQRQPG